MPGLTIVYWRDIPAQVMVGKGRTATRAELPPRFAEAIDRAAMKAGAAGTDAYLADWRRDGPVETAESHDPASMTVPARAESATTPPYARRNTVASAGT